MSKSEASSGISRVDRSEVREELEITEEPRTSSTQLEDGATLRCEFRRDVNLCRKELGSGDSVRVSMELIERLSAKLGVGLTTFLGVGVSMARVTSLLGRGGEINNASLSVSSNDGFVLLTFRRNSFDHNLFRPLLKVKQKVTHRLRTHVPPHLLKIIKVRLVRR